MAYQCRRRIYCDLFAWYWPAKRFVNRRYAFRSLWSPSFYHSGDRLLPDFFIGILYAQTILSLMPVVFSGYGQQFFRCRYLSQFDGSLPSLPSTANILIKAFVSGGQFLLPIIISLLVWANMWFGWSFLLAGAIMLINALFLLRCPFPPIWSDIEAQNLASACHRRTSLLLIDLISYTLYGYISMATFYLISQWLAQYGQFVAGMSYTQSIKLLSIYTCGSLLCVFITAPLVRKTIRSTTLLMFYTFISFIALLTVCLHPQAYVVMIFAFVIGFSSAGGVVQIGLTLMAARFPQEKR